jgi:hypothetical protein
MKKQVFSVLFSIAVLLTYAQTTVSGTQSGVWTNVNSPYEVTGEITVPSGQLLTIEEGVTVNFQGHYKFNVAGKMIVNGTENNRVVFTTDNTSTGWGGIRFDVVSEISEFNYCTISYGIATGNYPDMHGGAVLLKDSDAVFYHCIFENNKAIGSGDDGMGGAIYGINTGSSTGTRTRFEDCLFQNNESVTEGGAVKFTNDGKSVFKRCEFISNTASYGGGAIMFYSALDVEISKCLFYNNSTNNSGGGAILAMNPSVSLLINNCTFAYNTANGNSEGGAANLHYTTATFKNTIFYGNTQQYGKAINVGMNSTVTLDYCDVNMPDGATGSNNINVDPLFVAAADFHLQASSPCIDSGVTVGLAYEGTAPDMGCYEYGATASVVTDGNLAVKVYPNPANDTISFEGLQYPIAVTILNLQGEKLFSEMVFTANLDVKNLKNGVYLLKIKDALGKIKLAKLIVNRR